MAVEDVDQSRPAIDGPLVRALVDAQFPQYAEMPLKQVLPGGSDHAIFRLGADLTVRLPRHTGALDQAAKDLRWLPRLAGHLPLAVPVPVAVGEPAFGYPWPWAVARWLDGEVATDAEFGDSIEAALVLADFLRALRHHVPDEVPALVGSPELTQRPLAARDAHTRAAIAAVAGVFDAEALTAVWDAALDAPGWTGPAVWFHGDLHTGNILTRAGRLSAVIDFGGLGVGDPACDLTIAYTLMSGPARSAFREAAGLDEATWARGRGWALTTGLNAYTSYAATDARIARNTTRQIRQALAG